MTDAPLSPAFLDFPLAHRGLHDRVAGRVENSPSAIRAAAAASFGVEIDVRLTGDGHAVVFHDARLDRLTDRGEAVADATVDALRRTRLAETDDTIPTLVEVLDLVAGRVPLLVELKDPTDTLDSTDGRLERAVAKTLAGHAGPVAAMSFSPAIVAELARVAPALPCGLTTCAFEPDDWPAVAPETLARLRCLSEVGATGAAFVSHDHRDLGSPHLAPLREAGLTILTWTVRSPEEEAKARQIADNITFEGYLPVTV